MRVNKQSVKICIFQLAIIKPQSEQDSASEIIMYNSPMEAQDGMFIYVSNNRNSLYTSVWLHHWMIVIKFYLCYYYQCWVEIKSIS